MGKEIPIPEAFIVETMLEHALAHPMRHRIQLERLTAGRGGAGGGGAGPRSE